ncbi:MAG: hypothetical protein AAGI92_03570 [Pseudomonadota bacterium]
MVTGTTNTFPRWYAFAVLGALSTLVAVLLVLPVSLPIGAMYWDSHLYLDAANRISNGQIPHADFFAPVGALGYYLSALVLMLPSPQTLLASSWSILLITVPTMALVTWDVGRRDGLLALLLVLPFFIFSLLPWNTTPYYPFPGADGFAVYNRHTAQMLYVLVAAVIFMRHQVALGAAITILMVGLFLIKITGFISGGLLCVIAFASGRVHWKTAVASATTAVALLGAVELAAQNMVSAYLSDILLLVGMNAEGLASRFVQAASRTSGTTLFAVILGLFILWKTRSDWTAKFRAGKFAQLFDHPAMWLGAVVFAGLFFESQNTGNQEMLLLWPVVILIAYGINIRETRPSIAFVALGLCAATVLPMTTAIIQHASRALFGMVNHEPLQVQNLKNAGQLTMRSNMSNRARSMREIYIETQAYEEAVLDAGALPSFLLFSDFDFQILHHLNMDEAVGALKDLEAEGLEYETVMTLDFTNPFPWLLDKQAPLHITIGADPFRAVPSPDEETMDAVRRTDLVLVPTCPFSLNVKALFDIYREALDEHQRVSLTSCHDALMHPSVYENFKS